MELQVAPHSLDVTQQNEWDGLAALTSHFTGTRSSSENGLIPASIEGAFCESTVHAVIRSLQVLPWDAGPYAPRLLAASRWVREAPHVLPRLEWALASTRVSSPDRARPSARFGPTKILVFTVVNALVAIVNRHGQVVRGHVDRETGSRRHPVEDLKRLPANREPTDASEGHRNTPTLLVINSARRNNAWNPLAIDLAESIPP